LCLKKYAGEQVDSYPLIQGCGGVNKNFAATIKNLNDEYRCKPENRDNFIDENGRPSPETVHGKVNPLVDLQLINTQQLLKKLNNLNINPKDKEAPLIRELQARLKHEITTYEQQIGLTLQNTTTLQFRQRCLTHIGIIDRKLNTQSSWRPFIKNLALAISVVGTPFALASFGKRLSQGHYAFFNDAKAHRQVGRLETIAAKIKAQQASTQQEVDSERQNKPPTR
ncbi:MAG TPA: hypothetical protein DCG13_02350, partial [Legionellales bacterium]|nr:hypothetical protein [Legionellales bacterium]